MEKGDGEAKTRTERFQQEMNLISKFQKKQSSSPSRILK
jgi:hypothetical protein